MLGPFSLHFHNARMEKLANRPTERRIKSEVRSFMSFTDPEATNF